MAFRALRELWRNRKRRNRPPVAVTPEVDGSDAQSAAYHLGEGTSQDDPCAGSSKEEQSLREVPLQSLHQPPVPTGLQRQHAFGEQVDVPGQHSHKLSPIAVAPSQPSTSTSVRALDQTAVTSDDETTPAISVEPGHSEEDQSLREVPLQSLHQPPVPIGLQRQHAFGEQVDVPGQHSHKLSPITVAPSQPSTSTSVRALDQTATSVTSYDETTPAISVEPGRSEEDQSTLATDGHPPDIWDFRNKNEQKTVSLTQYSELLKKSRVTLVENLCLDDIWDYLLDDNVVSEAKMEKLKDKAPNHRQVDRLLDYVDTCPTWRFHAFLRACARTQQQHLIQELGLDPGIYLAPEAPFLQEKGKYLEHRIQTAIKDHCDGCQRTLRHRYLYDLADSPASETYDSTRTYITIKAKHMGDLQTKVPIDTLQILQKFHDDRAPNTIRLYGESGSGKSELLRMLTYGWSTSVLHPTPPIDLTPKADLQYTTIVYLPARNIRDSVDDAVREHLLCKKGDLDILMQHFNKGKGTALLIDALDEVRIHKVLKNIEEYVWERHSRGGPTVIVSARTDQCDIPSQAFSRKLTVEGFTESQSISYINKFFALAAAQNEENLKRVLDYVDKNMMPLNPILTNPLRLDIFSALTQKELLELRDDVVLNFVKLFIPLEKFLLERELKGDTISSEDKDCFYSMSLHCLLKGMRSIPQSVFNKYNVHKCFHVFMEQQRAVFASEDNMYRFTHEMVYEYFASRALDILPNKDKISLIMSICCEVNLRNVQYLVGQLILNSGDHTQQLFTSLVRCILILQHRDKNWELKKSKSEKSKFKNLFKSKKRKYYALKFLQTQVVPSEDLDKLLTHKVETPQSMWEEINNAFRSDSNILREVRWLSGLPEGTLDHVARCLRECPDDNMRRAVVEGTMYRLLPADYTDEYGWLHTVCPVGGVRWGKVHVDGDSVYVYAWCPHDVGDLLQTHSESHSELQTARCVYIFTDMYTHTWGPTPHSAHTQEVWDTVTHVLNNTCVELYIRVGITDPLHGLFNCLQTLIMWDERVGVYNGTVSVCDVGPCVDRCDEARVGLELVHTRVVSPQGQDDVTLKHTQDALLRKVNCRGERVLRDTEWVPVGGE